MSDDTTSRYELRAIIHLPPGVGLKVPCVCSLTLSDGREWMATVVGADYAPEPDTGEAEHE